MVKFLFDSDILITFLKGKELSKKTLLRLQDTSEIAVSVITIAEVLEGVVDNQKRLNQAKEFVSQFEIIGIDTNIAEEFASQRFSLRKSGNLIDNMDLLIAATALANNLILVTNNQKDFKKIKELKISS